MHDRLTISFWAWGIVNTKSNPYRKHGLWGRRCGPIRARWRRAESRSASRGTAAEAPGPILPRARMTSSSRRRAAPCTGPATRRRDGRGRARVLRTRFVRDRASVPARDLCSGRSACSPEQKTSCGPAPAGRPRAARRPAARRTRETWSRTVRHSAGPSCSVDWSGLQNAVVAGSDDHLGAIFLRAQFEFDEVAILF